MIPRQRINDRTVFTSVVFVVLLAQVLLYPGIDRLVESLGAETRLNASMWFLVAEFGAFVVFAAPWGAASDAAGRRVPFIAAGSLGGAVAYLLIAVVPGSVDLSFAGILGLRVLQGAFTIGAFSLAMTTLMDIEGGHGRNMGAVGVAVGLGTGLGAPLGGQLYEVGTLVPLYAAAALLSVAGLATLLVDETVESDGRDEDMSQIITSLRETPGLGVAYVFGFLDRMTAGFFALVGTLYFRTVFGLSPLETGLTLGLFFFPFAVLQYPFGVVSDRIGRVIPVVGGSLLYGVAVIGVGAAPTVTSSQATLVVVGVLGALMTPATMALVTDLADEDRRGVAMAGFNIAGSVGFVTGILVGGTVADSYGYLEAFVVAGGLEVVVALVALVPLLRIDT
ncbi:MAG: MFS transporter [Halobacteria archaeon]|nr:MFS transporter [Halobacteria archaeon]